MPQIIIYLISAAIAIGTNILLGSAIADFKDEFDKSIAILGLKKAGAILLAGGGLYYIGILMPDLVIDSLGVNLTDGLTTMAYSLVVIYVGKSIDNLLTLLKLKTDNLVNTEQEEKG
jgi:hypothetical protein